MALKKDDPWYVPLPDSRSDQEANRRYNRALRLSEMKRFMDGVPQMTANMQQHYADAITYRRECLERWQDYLNGKIEAPTGRKMKP